MSNEVLVSLKNVGCSYSVRKGWLRLGRYEALKDVTLDINRGETLGLIGKNGAGKSSLLRIINRILLPDSGTLSYADNINTSLLSLQAGFIPNLTGRDNAIMGALMTGYTRKEAEMCLDKIIEFAELGEWIDEPVKTYSSGMGARLGFAVAMEMSPDILLVDEVLGVGDETFRKKSAQAMKEKMRSGQTVVFVSHNQPIIKEVCSSLAWLDDGRIRMLGTPDEVLKAYIDKS
ncbi:MAG: ABC transporter ATP-binding protein [Syntrophotalea acetylenica]|nr:ABC transporter ATP-binding protein [Syntrophotalea acetylenica]